MRRLADIASTEFVDIVLSATVKTAKMAQTSR